MKLCGRTRYNMDFYSGCLKAGMFKVPFFKELKIDEYC